MHLTWKKENEPRKIKDKNNSQNMPTPSPESEATKSIQ